MNDASMSPRQREDREREQKERELELEKEKTGQPQTLAQFQAQREKEGQAAVLPTTQTSGFSQTTQTSGIPQTQQQTEEQARAQQKAEAQAASQAKESGGDDIIPKKMKAVFLTKYVEDWKSDDAKNCFKVEEVDVPEPKSGEVLIKMAFSPINPADLNTAKGIYEGNQAGTLPIRLGFEGSGTVVKSGGGLMGWLVDTKRVAAFAKGSGGLWADYVIVPATRCIALPDDVSFEQGCNCFLNPLTAIALVEIAIDRGQQTILHTAAASSLGKMLIKYAKHNGISVICIVRHQEQGDELLKLGAEHVIATCNDNWEKQLQALCVETDCTLGFECVAGPLTGKVLRAMPPESELQIYGGLSQEDVSGLSPVDFIFHNKKITGFWLTRYMSKKNMLAKKAMLKKVAPRLNDEFHTDISRKFNFDQVYDAIKYYYENMSQGKVVLKPY